MDGMNTTQQDLLCRENSVFSWSNVPGITVPATFNLNYKNRGQKRRWKPDLDTQIVYIEFLQKKVRENKITNQEANELMYLGCTDCSNEASICSN